MQRRNVLQTLAIGAVAVVALLGGLFAARTLMPEQGQPAAASPSIGGDFTLQSAEGDISLTQFRGKVVAIYFGYTYCPDACPTSLAYLGLAMKQLSGAEQSEVQPILISVDPGRDTPARLAEYVAHFHPNFIGVTGDEQQVAKVAGQYGVYYKLHKADADDDFYVVDHTSRTYILDRNGKLVVPLSHGTGASDIVKVLREVIDNA